MIDAIDKRVEDLLPKLRSQSGWWRGDMFVRPVLRELLTPKPSPGDLDLAREFSALFGGNGLTTDQQIALVAARLSEARPRGTSSPGWR